MTHPSYTSEEIERIVRKVEDRRAEKAAALHAGNDGLRHEVEHYENGVVKVESFRLGPFLHRVGAPARLGYTATGGLLAEEWWLANDRHRVDGPAHVIRDGAGEVAYTQWHIDGAQGPDAIGAAVLIAQWPQERAEFELRRSAFGPLFEAGFSVPEVLEVLRAGIFTPEGIEAIAAGAPIEWAQSFIAGSTS